MLVGVPSGSPTACGDTLHVMRQGASEECAGSRIKERKRLRMVNREMRDAQMGLTEARHERTDPNPEVRFTPARITLTMTRSTP